MFSKSAHLYDSIYSTFKNYDDEAQRLARLLREGDPNSLTVLDVACGTGEHARLLRSQHGFHVDGIDLDSSMIAIAREKNPQGLFELADMTDFELGRNYDAVMCLFGSIAYLGNARRLTEAFRCFRKHVKDGGTIMVEPFLRPEDVRPERSAGSVTANIQGKTVTRTSNVEIAGHQFRLLFDYRIESADGVQQLDELHDLTLFTDQEFEESFAAAGLSAVRQDPGLFGRGIWIAKVGS